MKISDKRIEFDWDDEHKIANCTLKMGKDGEFYGIAVCHDDDLDMANEYTGKTIAHYRASINYLKFLRDCRIKPGLAALNQLKYSMNRSKKHNPNSYEMKMVRSQISVYEEELEGVKLAIETLTKELKDFIDKKDKAYKKIRLFREGERILAERE